MITIIGNLKSIINGEITIDESENFLFFPKMINELKSKKCKKEIIELLEKGCELEDIASVIPKKMSEVINEMKQQTLKLMKNYETFNKSFWFE